MRSRYENVDSREVAHEVWPKYTLEQKDGLTHVTTWFRVLCSDMVYVIREYRHRRADDLHPKGDVLEYILDRAGAFYKEKEREALRTHSTNFGPADLYQGKDLT